ncbi:hypothetical protein PR048_028069 [Dryococelus australis]|uniref:Uncharacterized protein n=1 Tax=Dryococelus australis TaxID=614101 RepID=A0ABQ9GI92_9NEOP|nr:hypothetical protein PR048_028069 [Dryococelus australis]
MDKLTAPFAGSTSMKTGYNAMFVKVGLTKTVPILKVFLCFINVMARAADLRAFKVARFLFYLHLFSSPPVDAFSFVLRRPSSMFLDAYRFAPPPPGGSESSRPTAATVVRRPATTEPGGWELGCRVTCEIRVIFRRQDGLHCLINKWATFRGFIGRCSVVNVTYLLDLLKRDWPLHLLNLYYWLKSPPRTVSLTACYQLRCFATVVCSSERLLASRRRDSGFPINTFSAKWPRETRLVHETKRGESGETNCGDNNLFSTIQANCVKTSMHFPSTFTVRAGSTAAARCLRVVRSISLVVPRRAGSHLQTARLRRCVPSPGGPKTRRAVCRPFTANSTPVSPLARIAYLSHHCRSSERGVCSGPCEGPYTTHSVAAVVSLCGLRKFPSPDRKEHIAQRSGRPARPGATQTARQTSKAYLRHTHSARVLAPAAGSRYTWPGVTHFIPHPPPPRAGHVRCFVSSFLRGSPWMIDNGARSSCPATLLLADATAPSP